MEKETAISAVVDVETPFVNGEVRTVCDGAGKYRYFVVFGIIGNRRNKDIWVIVKEVTRTNNFHSCNGNELLLLRMDRFVRRVGLIHKCTDTCRHKFSRGAVSHSEASSTGGMFYVIGGHEGYPPFLG